MGLDMYLKVRREENEKYWRKANAIHGFFCDKCNNGEEINCTPVPVPIEELKNLYEICKEILETEENGKIDRKVAEELLPTRSGCFFGSQEYDESYIQDLKETKEFLEEILIRDCEEYSYEYDAWW